MCTASRNTGTNLSPADWALDASRRVPIAGPRILLAGGEGERIFSASDATVKLACQVARLVDWSATLESLAELGITRVLDLGPGHALAELMRSFRPDIRCCAADGFHTLDGLRNWLASP
ncbi:hypothetical protein [Bradyrhizobium cosmicum]|uniref:hypothetical protein n=1 Tax=Bradyrhizobium cosmicum TaxID=1404864 RepID=UPI0028E8CA39|nr:hypothetical protein [Bradyrhizobium cosmicum]